MIYWIKLSEFAILNKAIWVCYMTKIWLDFYVLEFEVYSMNLNDGISDLSCHELQ